VGAAIGPLAAARPGPNNNFTHNNYIDLIPDWPATPNSINGGMWMEFNHNGNTDGYISTPLPTGTEQYVTVTLSSVGSERQTLSERWFRWRRRRISTFSPADLGFLHITTSLDLDQWNERHFSMAHMMKMRIWKRAVDAHCIHSSPRAAWSQVWL